MTDDYSHLPQPLARVCEALEKSSTRIELLNAALDGEGLSASPNPLRQVEENKAALAAARQYRPEHWRAHVKAVDAICDELGIPTKREDGSRIFTEDRVRIALSDTPKEPSHD